MQLLFSILCMTCYHLVTSTTASIRPISPPRGKIDYFHDTEITPDGSDDFPPDVLVLPSRDNETTNGTRNTEEEIRDVVGSNNTHNQARLAQNSGCKTYYTTEGFIETPNPYSGNTIECYIIQSPAQFLLTWTDRFDIEDHGQCWYDYVEVYEHFSEEEFTGVLVGVYCGTTFPSSTAVSGPLIVRFISNDDVTGSGFRLNWELNFLETDCTMMSSQSGTIMTPNYPQNYGMNVHQCWRIETGQVQLTFNDFELEEEDSCVSDYVLLSLNGIRSIHCGYTAPPSRVFDGPATIVFHTDAVAHRKGFSLDYQKINEGEEEEEGEDDDGCTIDTEGEKSTTNHPADYPHYEDWCITVPGERVRLTFVGVFRLEPSYNCFWDYLSITVNGVTEKYCGRDRPESGTFDGPVVIAFHSDHTGSASGFEVVYQSLEVTATSSPPTSSPTPTTASAPPPGCDHYTSGGVRSTSNHPGMYNNNEDWCVVILAENVRLTFDTHFEIESHDDCVYDYLILAEHDKAEEKFCGRNTPRTKVYAGPVTMRFHSDFTATRRGFRVLYELIDDAEPTSSAPAMSTPDYDGPCEVKTGSGTISHWSDSGYDHNDEWCIIIYGERIQVTLDSIDIEDCSGCDCDYVSITMTSQTTRSQTTRYCVGHDPSGRQFSGPITVVSRSNATINGRGFQLSYTQLDDSYYERQNFDFPCGLRSNPTTRIFGGDNANHGEWPWQLLLKVSAGSGGSRQSRCGATLLSSLWAVTAAHCVVDDSGNLIALDRLSLTSGEHRRSIHEQTEVIHVIDQIIVHPENALLANDIALLHIEHPVIFTNFVRPVCLTRDVIDAGEICMATGWGLLDPNAVTREQNWDILQEVELVTIDNIRCGSYYASSMSSPSDDQLCTFNDPKAICQGDSGGPLVCENNNKYYLHGVSSWTSSPTCGAAPSGFQRVSHHIDWILETTSGDVSLTED